ncbi:MAG: hypothetical protein R6W76_15500 [Caldilinea sp.]
MSYPFSTIQQITILTTPSPTVRQRLAATELRRGLHQLGLRSIRTAELPGSLVEAGEVCFVLISGTGEHETYTISADASGVTLQGDGELGLLYAVFDFLERQGAVFGIDGESYPLGQ